MTDLHPLPKPAPHGDILRFIYEKDGGMTEGRERQEENRRTDLKRDKINNETEEENYG